MASLGSLSAVFGTAFVVGLSGAMMPGPLLAVTVTLAARRGVWAGPLLVAGHAALEGALVAGVVLGLARFLADPLVVGLIALVGGAVMGWMGRGMLRTAPTLSLSAPPAGRADLHPLAAGVVVSLLNPYWSLWWATVGLGYLTVGLAFGPAGIAAFFAGHILSDLAWYSAVSLAVARGRRLLSDPAYRRLTVACGLALLGFGLWFLITGVRVVSGRLFA